MAKAVSRNTISTPSSVAAGSSGTLCAAPMAAKEVPAPSVVLGSMLPLLLASGATVLVLFLWQGRIGFSLWDEGYLWYGVQRVVAGEVPLRDFSSYEPGRYYWVAALVGWMGAPGIVSVRAAAALFQSIGLSLGLAALANSGAKSQRLFWCLAAITIAAWMAPPHRLFDSSVCLALIGALSYGLARPSAGRWFVVGLAVGLAAVFGRNHGVYGAVGSLSAMACLALGSDRPRVGNRLALGRALPAWAAGVTIGFLPILLSIALSPASPRPRGEHPTSLRGRRHQHSASTALALARAAGRRCAARPSDLPGRVLHRRPRLRAGRRRRADTAAATWPPVIAASACLALPYAHFVYSRADLEHLALGVYPVLLGLMAMLAGLEARWKWSAGALLLIGSAYTMLPLHAAWSCRPSQHCVTAQVGADTLDVDIGTAGHLALLERLAAEYAPGDRTFIAAPFWPGAYAALARRSPMWDTYALFPSSSADQQAEIERIKAADPGFVVIYDASLDHRDDLNFDRTHPLIDRYIGDTSSR